MASVNYTLTSGETAWTEVTQLAGALTTASFIEVISGPGLEYIKATSGSTPSAALSGGRLLHLGKGGESQNIGSVPASESVFIRSLGKAGEPDVVVFIDPAAS